MYLHFCVCGLGCKGNWESALWRLGLHNHHPAACGPIHVSPFVNTCPDPSLLLCSCYIHVQVGDPEVQVEQMSDGGARLEHERECSAGGVCECGEMSVQLELR